MIQDEVLAKFEKIASIPRRSKHEAEIRSWIQEWARSHKFTTRVDTVGNVCVAVPGRGKYAQNDTIVIQGHLDMVCEKVPESDHDFSKDGLKLKTTDGWLHAEGTTLGADNGIAIALSMVLAEKNEMDCPPLELLFTVDEETGLTGASGLDPDLFTGKTLLNIDSEQEGVFTIGCAGGNNCVIELPLRRVNNLAKDAKFFKVSVSGARGGHSGIDIHKQRANAIRVLSRTLLTIRKDNELFIESLSGGSAHNAIPRDASANIVVERCDKDKLFAEIDKLNEQFNSEFKKTDPDLKVSITVSQGRTYFTQGATEKLLNLIHAIPHGVEAMSLELDGIVESSGNLATVETKGDSVSILTSHRSSNVARLDSLAQRVVAIAHLAEAKVKITDGYPPWQPNWDSVLLKKSTTIYKELFNREPIVEVIHAGLECGIIGEKKAGMEMISFGPTIENAHSPEEKLKIADIEGIWALLVALVQNI